MSVDAQTQYILDSAQLVFDPTAEAIIKGMTGEFDDGNYPAFDALLAEGIGHFLNNYKGGNGFLNNVKRRHLQGGSLSLKQKRAVVEIVRRAWRGEDLLGHGHGFTPPTGQPITSPTPAIPAPPKEGEAIDPVEADRLRNAGAQFEASRCYTCGKLIVGSYRYLMDVHKPACQASVTPNWTPNGSRNTRKIPRKDPEFFVNLRGALPEKGRYAIREVNGEVNFYIIETLKRRRNLHGRFNWSKYPSYTHQGVEPGAILVRKQSGDTKEFIGMQDNTDSFYIGEHEPDMKRILEDPTSAMVLYGQLIGACAYCGRSLTDDDSRQKGIGPDCWVQKHEPRLLAQGQRALEALRGAR